MVVAFFSNFINHHQIHVSRELNRILCGNFFFVEMQPMPDQFKKTGYPDYSSEPFVVKAWSNNDELNKAKQLVEDADAVLYTPYAFDLVKPRLVKSKLSIDVGERWFKRGWINIFSPTLLKAQLFYYTQINKESNYKLCASAYGCADQYKLHAFKDKCFKWGYFTEVKELDVFNMPSPRNGKKVSLMWCARFISWKHPELAIKLAEKLKKTGCDFTLDMFGDGIMRKKMERLAEKLDVKDVVFFHGNKSNDIILCEMQKHDIFLFTSDQNEGWGAVTNEAMANGCVIVGSNKIGSIPYLISDGENGCVFKSEDVDSLYEKVSYVMNDSMRRSYYAQKAYELISITWSPQNAAKNLVTLINDIISDRPLSIKIGPCSRALPI